MSILVLGKGLLGSEIVKQTGWDCLGRDECNILDDFPDEMFDCDIIVNCIGYTKTYDNNPQQNKDVNYLGVKRLIRFCNDWLPQDQIKLIHISTDYLYSGSVSQAKETDMMIPVKTWYGYYKLLADELVQLESNNYLICRGTHKPYPFAYPEAWANQRGNFDYVNVIAGLIIKLIEKGASGVYNVGTEEKTMFELAKRTRNVKGINAPDIVPKDVTMNLDKLNEFLK